MDHSGSSHTHLDDKSQKKADVTKQSVAQEILAVWTRLRDDRILIDDAYYRRAYEFTMPYRGMGFIHRQQDGIQNALTAKNFQSKIVDSTATDSVHTLASSLVTGLVPKNSKWFSLSILGAELTSLSKNARNWLQDASTVLHKHIHSSNFDILVDEFFQDIAICGYAGLYCEEIEDENNPELFRFHYWSPYEVLMVDSSGDGKIDTVYRQMDLTVAQAVSTYGYKNLAKELQDKYDSNPMDQRRSTFVHAVHPRGNYKTGKMSSNMPYRSTHVSQAGENIVREGGYNELPIIIPRWTVIPNTDYALGPINEALPDIKTINQVTEHYLSALEMNISGTFVAKNDGSINPNTARIGPRRIIYASDTNAIKALTSASDASAAGQELVRLQRQIRTAMKVDKLSPLEKPYQTATEVSVNINLIRQQLGPMYARLTGEFCEPLIHRCLNIAVRRGAIPPPPPELEGAGLTIVYQSPLARAQRQEELGAMDRFEQALAQVVQIYPDGLDIYDVDVALRTRAELLDVSVDILRSKEDVGELRRDQQEEEERQMAAMEAAQAQGQAPQQ